MGYKRNVNMDLVRILAVFSVISVHFFMNTGFYKIKIDSVFSYFAVTARTLFMICVPLFMILTGYLMCRKTLSKKYYGGIVKILIVYVLISIAVWVFRNIHLKENVDFWNFIQGTLNGSMVWYAWYMEMYFGLFLLIPFLNLIYNGLESKNKKIVLIATFLVLTMAPSFINDDIDIIPNFWVVLYPVTYYFIGAFIREFGVEIKKRYIFIIFIICLFAFGGFNFYKSYGLNFQWKSYCNWMGFENVIDSTLIFILISKLNLERLPLFIKKCMGKISSLALGIYLASCIFDKIFYPYLNSAIPDFRGRVKYYFIIVPCIFICSLIVSWIANFLAEFFMLIVKSLPFKKILKH